MGNMIQKKENFIIIMARLCTLDSLWKIHPMEITAPSFMSIKVWNTAEGLAKAYTKVRASSIIQMETWSIRVGLAKVALTERLV
jgi:hypothetical protein